MPLCIAGTSITSGCICVEIVVTPSKQYCQHSSILQPNQMTSTNKIIFKKYEVLMQSSTSQSNFHCCILSA